uniref:Uncharacterized protein n=1 Tax=Lepeophtheirus salmonis TaxID=72036 RepID=A0A0K2UXX0_LEPSM
MIQRRTIYILRLLIRRNLLLRGRWRCALRWHALLWRWWRRRRGRIGILGMSVLSEFKVQQNEENETHDPSCDEKLHILKPELILELPCLLLKLRGPVLKCIRSLVQF